MATADRTVTVTVPCFPALVVEVVDAALSIGERQQFGGFGQVVNDLP
jgi:hypothetical protein